MPDEEKRSESVEATPQSDPSQQPDEQAPAGEQAGPSGASADVQPAAGTEQGQGAQGDEQVATDAAEAVQEAEQEEVKVQYELLDATSRAGSIVDVKFKVPYEEYDKKAQEYYKELRRTVIIDGFRRGKAPLKLIQNRYHKEVKQDTLDFLVENCLDQIARDRDYTVLRQFDRVDPEVSEGQDLEFSVSLEIQPKIDPVGYDSFDVTVDTVKIDDDAVEAEIEKLRRRFATFETTETMPYSQGNGVTLDIRVLDDKGNEIKELTRKELFLAHPEMSLPGEVVEQLRGKRAGESFVVRVPNVRTSEGGVVVSEQDTYHVRIREVKRRVLPELNDEFARDVGGFDSVEALRQEIKRQLERSEQQRVREQALEKIYEQLIEKNKFDLPATMVRQAHEELLRSHQERLARLGLRIEDLGDDPKEYVLSAQRTAERLLRIIMLTRAIAEKEKIEPTDEDIDKAIARQAEREGRRPLAVRARLEARKEMDKFRDDVRFELVDDFLLSRAKIARQYISPERKIATT